MMVVLECLEATYKKILPISSRCTIVFTAALYLDMHCSNCSQSKHHVHDHSIIETLQLSLWTIWAVLVRISSWCITTTATMTLKSYITIVFLIHKAFDCRVVLYRVSSGQISLTVPQILTSYGIVIRSERGHFIPRLDWCTHNLYNVPIYNFAHL